MTYRAKVQRWYDSPRWRNARRRQLHDHPLCVMCLQEGLAIAASVADHIVPHRGDEQFFWDGELQSLCASHHSSDKRRAELGNADRPKFSKDGKPVW